MNHELTMHIMYVAFIIGIGAMFLCLYNFTKFIIEDFRLTRESKRRKKANEKHYIDSIQKTTAAGELPLTLDYDRLYMPTLHHVQKVLYKDLRKIVDDVQRAELQQARNAELAAVPAKRGRKPKKCPNCGI